MRFWCWIGYLAVCGSLLSGCGEEKIDFSSQVKPILNKRCISCHGGVKKNGGFSVLFREEALAKSESGKFAIVPGDPDNSEMIRRIHSNDPEVRMPYHEEPLPEEEIRILTNWIDQGAEWEDHWAYSLPTDIKVPDDETVSSAPAQWRRSPIDRFVFAKQAELDLSPSPEADRAILIRRLFLDIIGLPPSPSQVEAFLRDQSSNAYEKVIDTLLASPQFGEKWASWWLDLARYADTKGYEADQSRVIWRYRDYVIRSFNDDKPFDRFVIEQLAGDMLPDPTDDEIIATAFHRNTMNNDEGGTDDEEFRTSAVIDRVSTTWEVFQSTTMACVQCHSHPYDPIRHEEYYKALAYFNNTRDEDVSGEHPLLRSYEEKDLQKIKKIREWVTARSNKEKADEVGWFLKTMEPKIHAHVCDQFVDGELNGYKWLSIRDGGSARMKGVDLSSKSHVIFNYYMRDPGGSMEIRKGSPQGDRIAFVKLKPSDKAKVTAIPIAPTEGLHDLYFVFRNPALKPLQSVCQVEWLSFADLPVSKTNSSDEFMEEFLALLNAPVDNTPVFVEGRGRQQRSTRIFERGNWLARGEMVNAGVPLSLLKDANHPSDRLEFARWLVGDSNPLTARTIVNRVWEQLFGYGLIESLEDFGSQGSAATHPELLDWLANRMVKDYRWSIKHLIRNIVISETYRQTSVATDELLEKDPRNQWLARGPRMRLSAEQLRDQALAVSGLLNLKMFGKSVMPYQPEGIWNSVYNSDKWVLSDSGDQHRRSVYTFIKRTSPYPSLITFDGSSREVCVSRRIRTNTPLQALVTLNDPVFVEASQALARRMIDEAEDKERGIAYGYQLVASRQIQNEKLDVLVSLYDDAFTKFSADSASTHALAEDKHASPHLAAMITVANTILNLDEAVTKE